MEENIVIRNEKKEDWETVEKITRQAFYNLYVPGVWNTIWSTSCGNMRILFRNWILYWNWTDR